ncbi:MAG: trypsin-like peptidase domain-containing protein [Candidatus Marinimicrobia bacterium]|jgi:serine protease Do|nr:2-alkenal reductase [Candidatus Neomarinimicrobiota bacterium]MCH2650475.1 trypsin-like peptidase domain-containing protein [Candidatus Neomarinimicrobiota bacterium]|tara:strand:- start:3216 stop:4298 length:1083 start_codon:yes stop_codon:yes gene_type:complete
MHKHYLRFIICLTVSIPYADEISKSRETAITRAIEKVGPAVASINVEQHISSVSYDPFFGFMYPREIYPMKSSGSGVVISPDGFVMTNHHVIENADKVTVTLSGGDEYEAEIIGSDETSDLALIKLSGSDFPYAELANSDDLLIGEWVIALGNPFELFSISNKPSASVGIISATNMDFGMQKSGKVLQDMIQTDAAINPGNSGGPLVNAMGQVIGINTFIFTDYEHFRGSVGIGFAIPINSARRIAEELRMTGEIDRGYSTGLIVQSVTRSISRYLDIPFVKGVIIVEVNQGSPADMTGLEPGDVILSVNGEDVNKPSDIRTVILENDLRSGDKVTLQIFRNGNYKKVKMRLGKYRGSQN